MPPIPITRAEYEAKFGKPTTPNQAPQPTGQQPIPISRAAYQAKFAAPKPFTYPVQESSAQRANKLSQYQAEAKQAETESTKANSFLGKLGNFGKAFVSNIAGSEVGLGKSIAKIIGAGDKNLTDAQQRSADIEYNLVKRINDDKAKGLDTTRLEQAYNQLKGGQGEVNQLVKEQFNLPTTGQVVGQIGGTALDILSAGTYGKAVKPMVTGSRFIQPSTNIGKAVATGAGLPELGALATQKASGLLTRKGLGNIATGAGIGYVSDVTQGLQGERQTDIFGNKQDRTGGKAFIPGIGTALGATIPAISEGTQSIKNQFTEGGKNLRISTKRAETLTDIEKKYPKVGKAFAMGDKKGVDVRGILSNTNILNGAVDEDGLISAERALGNFDELVTPYENKVRQALQTEKNRVRIDDIASAMDDYVAKTDLQGNANTKLVNELQGDLKGLQARYGANIPVEALHDIKVFRGNSANYTDTGANIINKDATRFFKEIVENNTRTLDVKKYNSELSKLYTVRDAIEALDRKRVKGGRAGKYFSSLIGTGIGASTGNPLLAILGAEIGAKTQGTILGRSLGGNISKGMEIPSTLTDILATKIPRKNIIPPVSMPKTKTPFGELNLQSSNKTGNRNINQTTTNIPVKNAISKTIPLSISKENKGLGTITPKIFERAKNLNTTDRAIETKAFDKIKKKEVKILSEYKTKYGNVVNTDNFRPFFTDIGYKGSNSASVQEPASYLAKKAYTKGLNSPEPYVTFLAGGSGSGKTKAVKRLKTVGQHMRDSAVVYDSNLSSYNSAISKIKEAEKAGKKIEVNFIYRDPMDAFEGGVVKRMLENKEEMGRLVPAKVVAENHVDSFNVVRRLQDEGYRVRYIDNSLGQNKSRVVTRKQMEEKAGKISKEELKKAFINKAKELYGKGKGKISKEELEGYLG